MGYRAFIASGLLLLSNSFASVDLYSQIEIISEFEKLQPHEEEDISNFTATVSGMQRHHANKTQGKNILRAFHAKSHGCLKGHLNVEKNLPNNLSQGIFIRGKTYSTIARFSNGKGLIEADSALDVKGLAFKVLNVPGERLLKLPSYIDNTSMDFTMTNNPTPLADNVSEFISLGTKFEAKEKEGKSLATMSPAEIKELISNDKIYQLLIDRLVKRKVSTLVTETFWSGSPYLFGKNEVGAMQAAKWNVTPCDEGHKASTSSASQDPNFLRTDLINYLQKKDLCYNLNVQIQNNKTTQPIENHLTEWKESETASIKIATLVFKSKENTNFEKQDSLCETISFNPWNGIKAHQPLGNMNRARGEVYLNSFIYRINDANFRK